MTEITDLHARAMQLAEEAEAAQRAGSLHDARSLFRDAYSAEREAAQRVPANMEPTRSILLRSAASLALEAGEPQDAERLACMGLAGNAPEEIREELRGLYETIRRMVAPDVSTRTWKFDAEPPKWPKELSEWLDRWFAHSAKATERPDLADCLSACHQILTEIEATTFGARSEGALAATVAARVPDFKALFEWILPGATPRVSSVAWKEWKHKDEDEEKEEDEKEGEHKEVDSAIASLQGFDQMFGLALFEDAFDQLAESKALEPTDLVPMVRQDEDVQFLLREQKIVTAFAVPIRLRRPGREHIAPKTGDDAALEVVSFIILWLNEAPTVRQVAAISSLLRRIANFAETTFDRTIQQERIHDEED